MRVFKFGGASIKDAEAIQNVAKIILDQADDQLMIIVSAMGKTTNASEEIVEAFFKNKSKSISLLKDLKEAHFVEMEKLGLTSAKKGIQDLFVKVEKWIETTTNEDYDFVYDQIVSVGELASTKIMAAFLNTQKESSAYWLDARTVIRTDDTFREGRVDWKETEKNAQNKLAKIKESIIFTQGFIGGTNDGRTTTLGREGSDFSAAIFSYCLNAETMTIWKDVPGILTGDPRLFKNLTKMDQISYREAIEMTYYGAKVIHPKTIKPLQNKNIPLYVKCFLDPSAEGTLISEIEQHAYPPVIVVENDQVLLLIRTKDFSFVAEHHLSHIFTLFNKHRIKINMMRNSAISFMVSFKLDEQKLENLEKDLLEDFSVNKHKDLELITIRHYHENMLSAFREGRIIMHEERNPQTIQMILRNIPKIERI